MNPVENEKYLLQESNKFWPMLFILHHDGVCIPYGPQLHIIHAIFRRLSDQQKCQQKCQHKCQQTVLSLKKSFREIGSNQ